MFTGIVEDLAEVTEIRQLSDAATITISSPRITQDAHAGDSISVSGVCLTVTGLLDGTFTADVMRETLNRSSLGALGPGDQVNLERSVRVTDRLGGHLVQGHVDGTGTVAARTPGRHWEIVRVTLPPGLARYVVEKGSITVDGVSLTVSALGGDGDGGGEWFEVSLIPETLKRTTLGGKQPGQTVNLEVDVIAKYVEKLLGEAR
ncbi:MAG: riboflavin synthase [Streptosporangiaceae bacterium]|nr:riboflavin synthase [Streptosporangiaceae bacterium]MBV9855186.1 riboflavin synthase [Streptosporangiaceae bacterium]